MTRKVCVVITARASYARVKSILREINKRPDSELLLVTTCSASYDNVAKVIENDGFHITEKVNSFVSGDTLKSSVETTGQTLIKLASVFEKLSPDVVVTNGDRYETIATAITAAYMNIPLAHLQGGDVTGNIDEKVRHAITKLADLHFPTSELSRQRLLALGENPDKVFMFGCPSIDIIRDVRGSKELGFNPIEKYKGFGSIKAMPEEYYVVMQHPTTTDKNSVANFGKTLNAVEKLNKPTFIFLPNIDSGADEITSMIKSFEQRQKNVYFFYNMQPEDFIKFIYHAKCLIGNSSVGIRECAYLGIPVVNVGDRQLGRQRAGNVIDAGYDSQEIYDAVRLWEKKGRPAPSDMYGNGHAGEKIAETLATAELSSQKRLTYKI